MQLFATGWDVLTVTMTTTKTKGIDMTTKIKGGGQTMEQLEAQVHSLGQRGRDLAQQAERLEEQLRIARGTQRIVKTIAPKTSRGAYSGREPDEVSTPELYEQIRKLVSDKPMRFRDIVEATQAGENRIKGVLVRLQREEGCVNLGDTSRALWFIPDEKLLKRLGRARRR